MSLSAQERYDVVIYRLEKAQTTLEQAKGVLNLRYWEIIANRLYYAAYYAVSALLIANGYQVKSNEGIVTLFGLHFVKEGIVPQKIGRFFNHLLELKLNGDYSDNYNLTEEDVLPLFEPTEQLIDQVSALAKEALNDNI